MALIDGCIFCKIIRGEIPCHQVLQTTRLLAFMDINPLSQGHVLVVPKYHGECLHDVPDDYLSDILPAIRRIGNKAFGELGIAYNVLQNNGKLAHQEVDHVHFHIIPRRNSNEGLGIKWATKTVPQDELAKFATALREAL